jgi:RNA polymerase sigma factor (sigma-70 family)
MDEAPPTGGIVITRQVWSTAYVRYRQFWMNLAKGVGVPEETALDIVHGVLESLLVDSLKTFESIDHLRNYVARAVINRSIQNCQREGRSTRLHEQFDLIDSSSLGSLETIETAHFLRQALLELSPESFEIIKLRFFGGYTFAEISQLLGIPISTLKSREEAALKRVRRWLRKKGVLAEARAKDKLK